MKQSEDYLPGTDALKEPKQLQSKTVNHGRVFQRNSLEENGRRQTTLLQITITTIVSMQASNSTGAGHRQGLVVKPTLGVDVDMIKVIQKKLFVEFLSSRTIDHQMVNFIRKTSNIGEVKSEVESIPSKDFTNSSKSLKKSLRSGTEYSRRHLMILRIKDHRTGSPLSIPTHVGTKKDVALVSL